MRVFYVVAILSSACLWMPFAAAAATQAQGELSHSINPDTGLQRWHWQGGGISLEMIQRLPDQSRAFFAARGFPPDAAEQVAEDCVFQTVLSNADPDGRPVQVDLAQWRVQPAGGEAQAPILEEQWDAHWREAGLPDAARIAFRWATFPTDQIFEDADYNWGMTTLGLPPGTEFELRVRWLLDGEPRTVTIPDMHCAPDVAQLVEERP
ncbi:hypothetical protein HUS23_02585 [Ectothiorhodospiraceae bacterium 2226]|nr:hypothetical protein HUS23_02585 [Ectothiorhodospiraceae bacterium 2226]